MLKLSDIYVEDNKSKYKSQLEIIKSLNFENIPNLLIYGSEGTGKKNMLSFFLGNTKKNKIINSYKISSKEVFFTIFETNQYIEIDLNEIKMYKNIFLKKFIKDVSQTYSVLNNKNKVIIIHGIELLEKTDQFVLRKIMEDNIRTCRFILLSKTIDNLLTPIISRCLCLRLEGFNRDEIIDQISSMNICHKSTLKNIVKETKNDMKKTILESYISKEVKKCNIKDYKGFYKHRNIEIGKIIKFIKSPKKITKVNIKDIEIVVNNLNINFEYSFSSILKFMMTSFCNTCITKYQDKNTIYMKTLEIENRIKSGSKGIIHIQSYIYYLKFFYSKNKH